MSNFKSLFVGMLTMMVSVAVCAGAAIGSRELNIAAPSGTRHLQARLWYPTQEASPTTVEGENPVFYGITVIKDAAPEPGRHPLVLLSHGYRGSWRNLSWLAAALVQKGYIVAAPDHPGTTTFNVDPTEAAHIWERPHDLSRVINHLLQSSSVVGEIEPSRIAAIGHSLGGWTVMAAGGARFSATQFLQDCQAGAISPIPCKLSAELGLDQASSTPLHANLRDPRIAAVVALDLGGARGFTVESLATYPVPALVLSAELNINNLPAEAESGYLAAHLPKGSTQAIGVEGATHFSFMQLCKPGAIELMEASDPGEGVVCQEHGSLDRLTLHQRIANMVISFLQQHIPTR